MLEDPERQKIIDQLPGRSTLVRHPSEMPKGA